MRIKFEKGMTPERIAQAFVEYVRKNNLVIGSVNIYIQTYDEEMRPVKFNRNEEYIVCSPVSEKIVNEYIEDVARIRRNRIKAVNE
jgi:hypothetical protein